MKLMVRPKPEKGESFIGYLVRLTGLNGYDTPSWILSLAGIDCMELQWTFSFVFDSSKGLEKLAQLTDNDLSNLTALSYSPPDASQGEMSEHEYNFYGAFLNRSIIRPHCPKICPKCLAESGYCLRVWDCSLVTACPIHACMFIDCCPKCKRRIRAIRNSLSVCICGCDSKEIEPGLLTGSEVAVSRRVYQLCGLFPKTPVEASENPLRRLDLRDFTVVLTFICGLFRKMAWATGRPSKSIKLRNTDLHQLYNRAYSIFEDWPHNFHQFLRKQSKGEIRLNPTDGKLDTALTREFGSFYKDLYLNLDGAQFDFMRESFAEFLTDILHSKSQPARVKSYGPSSEKSPKYISVTDARRSLMITTEALFDLIESGEIRSAITNGKVSPEIGLNITDIERLKGEFEQSITERDLAEQLGVDRETVRQLARKGLLKPRSRRSTEGFNIFRFRPCAVEEFLRKPMNEIDPATALTS